MGDTWAAKVLADVPRFYPQTTMVAGEPSRPAIWEADALAAIARMGAGGGLVDRATAARDNLMVLSDTKSWLATRAIDDLLARIAALTAEVAEMRAVRREDALELLAAHEQAQEAYAAQLAAEAEAAALRERVARLEGALGKIAEAKAVTNSATNVQTIWSLAETARAALTDGGKDG